MISLSSRSYAHARLSSFSRLPSSTGRLLTVLSVESSHSQGKDDLLSRERRFSFSVPTFVKKRSVSLPLSLPVPSYMLHDGERIIPEEFRPQRFANGKLGSLVHAHGSLLFFASFVRPSLGADLPKYVGIEVIDWTLIDANANQHCMESVLLEYPDSHVGKSRPESLAVLTGPN